MSAVRAACAPYDTGPVRAAPVNISGILNRLTERELKDLAIGYAIHAPRFFETQLLELWAARDGKELVKPLADA